MKSLPALVAVVAVSAGIAVMDAVALILGFGSWLILVAAALTLSVAFALLCGEVIDR